MASHLSHRKIQGPFYNLSDSIRSASPSLSLSVLFSPFQTHSLSMVSAAISSEVSSFPSLCLEFFIYPDPSISADSLFLQVFLKSYLFCFCIYLLFTNQHNAAHGLQPSASCRVKLNLSPVCHILINEEDFPQPRHQRKCGPIVLK